MPEIEATGQNRSLGVALWQIGVPQDVVRDQSGARAADHQELALRHLNVTLGPEKISQASRGQMIEVGVIAQFVR